MGHYGPNSKLDGMSHWTTKQTLANSLVQFGYVSHQTPKSKVNGPSVNFPYNVFCSITTWVIRSKD